MATEKEKSLYGMLVTIRNLADIVLDANRQIGEERNRDLIEKKALRIKQRAEEERAKRKERTAKRKRRSVND